MTTAIYIVQGETQVVLTPENDWEKQIVQMLADPNKKISTFLGGFYECRGGWYRESTQRESLMFRIESVPPIPDSTT